MKKTRLILFISGLVVAGTFGFLAIKSILAQSAEKPAFQKIYEGNFDVTRPGDVVQTFMGDMNAHWKRIEIPEIKLDDMPAISVYLEPTVSEAAFRPENSWVFNEAAGRQQAIAVKGGELYIWYKNKNAVSGKTYYFCTGQYKIVVTYTKKKVVVQPVKPISAEPSVKLKEGDLVKSPASGKIYLVEDSKLRYITSPCVFNEKGYKWSKVKDVAPKVINRCEEGVPVVAKKVGWQLNYEFPERNQQTVYCFAEYKNKLYAGTDATHMNGRIYVYDGSRWQESFVPERTFFRAMAVYQNKLYAAGISGSPGNDKGSIYVFDGNEWKLDLLPEDPEDGESNSYLGGLAVYKDKIYAFGDENGVLVNDGSGWSVLPFSPEGLAARKGVVVDDKLYVGRYCFDGESWTNLSPLSIRHSSIAGIEYFDEKVYYLISKLGYGQVMSYDPNTDNWASFQLPVYDSKQLSGVLASHNNKLYITVGTANRPAKIYTYSPLGELYATSEEIHFSAFGVYNNRLYVAATSWRDGPGRIYVFKGGKEAIPIPSKPVTNLKFKEGDLVKSPASGKIYLVEDSKLRYITSPCIFKEKGYKWSKVKDVVAEDIASCKKGLPVK